MTTAPVADRRAPGLLAVAGVLILGLAAPMLDSTIVNVALSTLGRDLHVTLATIQWVSTAYLLAMAVAVPITGWAGERFGVRTVWIAALVLFAVGSAASGLAGDVGVLIAFRALQGLGTGLMMPLMMTTLMKAAGGSTAGLGGVMALISLPTLLGPVLGPVIGGLIVDHASWRWIFYVNLPLCVVAIATAWWVLPRAAAHSAPRLDVVGLLLASPALAALVDGLAQIGEAGGLGHVRVLVPLGVGTVLLAAFVTHALRRPEPLVDLRLFRVRSFTVSAVLLFFAGLSTFGAMLLLPLYYMGLRGASVVTAGLLLAPQGLGIGLSRIAGGMLDRWGARALIIGGTVLLALGTVPFALADAHTNIWLLATALVVRGTGLGTVTVAVMLSAYADLEPAQIPHASSLTRVMQQIGGSFGTAVLAVILQRQLVAHPGAGVAAAYQNTFWWAQAFTVLALGLALMVPGRRAAEAETTAPVDAAGAGAPGSLEMG